MKNGKCPGKGRITREILQLGREVLIESGRILLYKCSVEAKIPAYSGSCSVVQERKSK